MFVCVHIVFGSIFFGFYLKVYSQCGWVIFRPVMIEREFGWCLLNLLYDLQERVHTVRSESVAFDLEDLF